jgi:hypothetical protein
MITPPAMAGFRSWKERQSSRPTGDNHMTDDNQPADVATPAAESRKGSKAASVMKLLSRTRGATMAELVTESGWQAHTVRAHLSGLRKKHALMKEMRRSGESFYRIEAEQPAKAVDEQLG